MARFSRIRVRNPDDRRVSRGCRRSSKAVYYPIPHQDEGVARIMDATKKRPVRRGYFGRPFVLRLLAERNVAAAQAKSGNAETPDERASNN